MKSKRIRFNRLLKIMEKLLSKDGCPWDREQTHKTLLKHLESEVKEFKIAVRNRDFENMKEELGDILLQVVFHCEIAKKKKKFDISDVIDLLISKLVRRHPHVFGNASVKNSDDVVKQWNKIKKMEAKWKYQKK
ncbi:MAG: hypothetical protein K6357_00515 [Elusimicrobiota bacterium]